MTLLSLLSMLALFTLAFVAPAQGLGHLCLVAVRRLRKRPTRFRWASVGPLAVIGLLVLFAILMSQLPPSSTLPPWASKSLFAVFLLLVTACLTVPLWYLVQVYSLTRGGFRVGSYVLALLALLAMPVAATYINAIAASTGKVLDAPGAAFGYDLDPHRFIAQANAASSSPCSRFLSRINNTTLGNGQSVTDNLRQLNASVTFWFDQTLSGAFFDGAEVFDCHLSNLSNNPNDMGFATLIILYRLFSEFILVTVVVWPFVLLLRRMRREPG